MRRVSSRWRFAPSSDPPVVHDAVCARMRRSTRPGTKATIATSATMPPRSRSFRGAPATSRILARGAVGSCLRERSESQLFRVAVVGSGRLLSTLRRTYWRARIPSAEVDLIERSAHSLGSSVSESLPTTHSSDRVARVREDRSAARLPVPRQRRSRPRRVLHEELCLSVRTR